MYTPAGLMRIDGRRDQPQCGTAIRGDDGGRYIARDRSQKSVDVCRYRVVKRASGLERAGAIGLPLIGIGCPHRDFTQHIVHRNDLVVRDQLQTFAGSGLVTSPEGRDTTERSAYGLTEQRELLRALRVRAMQGGLHPGDLASVPA